MGKTMLRVEFHCHTIFSKDSLTTPEKLLETSRRKGIDRVVITDHNRTGGALQAKALDPQRVIIGEEIMTSAGELLAAFVQEELPAGLAPMEAIARLREQGAFISVSHPFDHLRSGHWKPADLLEIAPHVDAIETFNSRCMWPSFNTRAQAFAQAHNLPGTAGSDAHAPSELGRATLLLPEFSSAESLRAVLRLGEPRLALSGPWVHFYSRYAVWRKRGVAKAGRSVI
jgi:predicted metal-dependent phosphoesterase TrpH